MRFQLSQFFCWDLATGAKIIGSLGVLKHSLAILVIYLDGIDLWVVSSDKETNKIPTILFTFVAILLIIGFVVNVVNIVLSYRLFKILETNQIQDLTNWINAERISLTLFAIYFAVKILYGELDFKHIVRLLSFIFDIYCYLCVMSLREDYRQRASLLASQT
ncbi:CLUMA_CG019627, isoform A [Clunio marinus]|uniref:CLUMA_CG019627, isoform A n=1 Tax=Clunio marinus TaxID=568069 RepID=A0A1J1J405_9DIPT|nr:CLUMA_CG019627, isoform A [Clunio marinus]